MPSPDATTAVARGNAKPISSGARGSADSPSACSLLVTNLMASTSSLLERPATSAGWIRASLSLMSWYVLAASIELPAMRSMPSMASSILCMVALAGPPSPPVISVPSSSLSSV